MTQSAGDGDITLVRQQIMEAQRQHRHHHGSAVAHLLLMQGSRQQSVHVVNNSSTVYVLIDWLSMVLCLHQHNIGYTADGFYRSDDPTNSV